MTTLYFVRHGESISNLNTQFAGSLDMPLTEKGRDQAKATAQFLKDVPFSAVYASDLQRAYDTGFAIAEMHALPVHATAELREIYAGDWEGKSYAQLDMDYPDSYGVWRRQIGLAQCPNGESVAQLQARISAFVFDVVRQHPDQTVCIATHATPIRVMECIWEKTPLSRMHTIPWVSNASVTVAVYDGDDGRLLYRDQHEHLGDLHTILAKNV